MLIFNSLLVELGYFATLTMGFLIVGHTHASIDQYFSCLRRRIRRAKFIASPPALHHLFTYDLSHHKEKKKKAYRPPLSQLRISFVRDYVEAFEPYFNKKINNYGIPYDFKFYMVYIHSPLPPPPPPRPTSIQRFSTLYSLPRLLHPPFHSHRSMANALCNIDSFRGLLTQSGFL